MNANSQHIGINQCQTTDFALGRLALSLWLQTGPITLYRRQLQAYLATRLRPVSQSKEG